MKYYIIFIAAMSFISFVLYSFDKIRAKMNTWRIKEAVLLGFGFFGGALGALTGMIVFHHKTKHWYFWIVNFAGLALQVWILFRFFI